MSICNVTDEKQFYRKNYRWEPIGQGWGLGGHVKQSEMKQKVGRGGWGD